MEVKDPVTFKDKSSEPIRKDRYKDTNKGWWKIELIGLLLIFIIACAILIL